MASDEHIEVLKSGVEKWNAWRKENPGIAPRFYAADLAGIDASGANLAGAELEATNLTKANLHGADLAGACLSDASLSGANLSGAKLAGVYMFQANAIEARFVDADFSGAMLRFTRFSRADLSEARLSNLNLYGSDFAGANLSRANLWGAFLEEADLSGASLKGAQLRGVNLVKANLTKADLSEASLENANATGANFSAAKLVGTYLRRCALMGANLDGADLSEAWLDGTGFGGTHLSGAKGLEMCRHTGPSTLDMGTIQLSKNLPPLFLHGCGLEDDFIRALPKLPEQSATVVYVRHAIEDAAFARKLHDRLQAAGIRCWLDEELDRGLAMLERRSGRELEPGEKVLWCGSSESLWGGITQDELERTLQLEAEISRQAGVPVRVLLPLDLDGYVFSEEFGGDHQEAIRQRVVADFRGWVDTPAVFEAGLTKVIRALRPEG